MMALRMPLLQCSCHSSVCAVFPHTCFRLKKDSQKREQDAGNEGVLNQPYSPVFFTSSLPLSLTFTCHSCWLSCEMLSGGNVRCPMKIAQNGELKMVSAQSICCESLMDTPILQVCAKTNETIM